MQIYNFNSYLIVLILYLQPLSLIFSFHFTSLQIKISLLIFLIIIAILINKLKFNSKFVVMYVFLTSLLLLNLLTVQYKDYVLADAINILLVVFIPLYIFTLGKYSFENIINMWYRTAWCFTFLLPLYYFYLKLDIIDYMDFGFLTHLNSIIFIYYFFKGAKNNKLLLLLLILLNSFLSLLFGSRMIFVATVVVFLVSLFIFYKNTPRALFGMTTIIVSIAIVALNMINILEYLMQAMQERGIRSRNVTLFYDYLTNDISNGVYLAGREEVYSVVVEYLKTNAFLPSGLSVARFLTNDAYYHSHSFYLEFPLVFGFIFSILILIYLIYKLVILYKIDSKNQFPLVALMIVSFFSRSLTGTYFVHDSMFIIIVMLLISTNKKNGYYIGRHLCSKGNSLKTY